MRAGLNVKCNIVIAPVPAPNMVFLHINRGARPNYYIA